VDQNGLTTGMEWMIDARGCVGESLCRLPLVQQFCETVISELSLHVVGSPQWHQFPAPGGVTGLYLLTESHLACHTFPELGLMTLNLYCCRPRQEFSWQEALKDAFGAGEVQVTRVARGGLPDPKSRMGTPVTVGIDADLTAELGAAYPGTAVLSRNAGGH
jgi:S-adenosylmethionine decarboxylase